MAIFLVMAALTGSLLAWNEELEAAISPELFKVHIPKDAAPRDPIWLRQRVQTAYPDATIPYAPLTVHPGRSLAFYAVRPVSADGVVPDNQIFLDPYSGRILGSRLVGDISQGTKNLMPFIYRLHQSLAIGGIGKYILGAVALAWTIDCFIGLWLTFPLSLKRKASQRAWLARWLPAWKIRMPTSQPKLVVDLHRANGLWLWPVLLVVAFSSVAFNLREVYNPVMSFLFAHQEYDSLAPLPPAPQKAPGIPWENAREIGQTLMKQAAKDQNFEVIEEIGMLYDATRIMYRYDVRSSLDVRDKNGLTFVFFDANTGVLAGTWLPTGAASGDTIRMWITSIHMTAMWGWPFQIFMSALGLIVTVLSVTGVLIWHRKRRAIQKKLANLKQRVYINLHS